MTTQTFGELVAMRAADLPDHPVIRFENSTLTYGRLDSAGDELARRLTAAGISPGTRVATMLPNRPEAIETWLALDRLGAIEVPLNTQLKGALLADQIARAGCEVVITDAAHGGQIAEPAGTEQVKAVLSVDETDTSQAIADLDEAPLPLRSPEVDAPALILYTSGTTGPSKGVVLSHVPGFRLAKAIIQYTGLTEGDTLYTTFPLFHIAARFVSVVAAMVCGGTVVVHDTFSASQFWDVCRREGVTAIHYLGSVPMMLWKQPPRDDDAANTVRVAYGAGMPASIWTDFEARYGLTAFELYGSTEQGVVAMNSPTTRKVGTCGKPTLDVDLEIHDSDDRSLASGEVGEIVVRPREPGIFFTEYDGMATETVQAFRNLWFHTGDAGSLDDDGFLCFHGRLKDAIRRRGENISAWEVEHTLLTHPAIAEVAAIGVPSDLGEEEVLVAVVLDEEQDLHIEDIVAFAEELLPSFAVPRYVRLVERLPRTASDRVEKWKLQEDGVTDDTFDRDSAVPRG